MSSKDGRVLHALSLLPLTNQLVYLHTYIIKNGQNRAS